VTVNGAFAEGEVRLDDSGHGGGSRSAFLAFPETWNQPAGAQQSPMRRGQPTAARACTRKIDSGNPTAVLRAGLCGVQAAVSHAPARLALCGRGPLMSGNRCQTMIQARVGKEKRFVTTTPLLLRNRTSKNVSAVARVPGGTDHWPKNVACIGG
jgi:hypothetical protein